MPELIDICDEHGSPTGETMVRSEAHRTEARHGVVLLWVYNSQGEVLLQQRALHLNAFPGKWDVSVAGHIMAGENPEQTALRELGEELGIFVQAEDLITLTTRPDDYPLVYGKQHREFDYLFAVRHDVADGELKLQVAEVADVRWITSEQLMADLADSAQKTHYSGRNVAIFQTIAQYIDKNFRR